MHRLRCFILPHISCIIRYHISCFFFPICLSVCCSDWAISILSSRSLIYPYLFSLLFIASRLLFVLETELSVLWFIFTVSSSLLQCSALILTVVQLAFLLPPFWTRLVSSISLFVLSGGLLLLFKLRLILLSLLLLDFLCLCELRRNSYLLWSWKGCFCVGTSLCGLCVSSVFGPQRAGFDKEASHAFPLGLRLLSLW